jgi:regulatory protein
MKSPYNQNDGSFSRQDILLKCEAFCAYQDRCTFDILAKLEPYQLQEEDRLFILEHLRSNKFLDDERYAESFVSGKFRIKYWGKLKLNAELRKKRISNSIIQKALLEIPSDEYMNTIQRLLEKKFEQLSTEKDSFKRDAKLIRFLAGKGFELDLIQDVLRDMRLKHSKF